MIGALLSEGSNMNENVVDILIYLYENYMDAEQNPPSDQQEIHEELVQAGFPEREIDKAFQWMDELALRQDAQNYRDHTENSMRIYTDEEKGRLDADCRGLMLFLEQNSILDQASRELVIDRATALDTQQIGVEELKWIVLMVLINRPGQESAFAQMEDLVYNDIPVYLH
jgi:Smg protein